MGKIREWAKGLLYLDFLYGVGGITAAGAIALVGIVAAVVRGDFDHLPQLLLVALGVGGLLAFIGWVSRDARRTARELRLQRRERGTRPRADGDLSDVAGVPQNPPWMG